MYTVKSYFFSRLLCLTILFSSSTALGQGWQWGRGANGAGADAWATATDRAGNVFAAGMKIGPGAISFGTHVVPTYPCPLGTCNGGQTFWVKYDNSGTVQWAGGTSDGDTYLINIATDTAGNLFVFGYFHTPTMQIGSFVLSNSYTGPDALQYFLAKIDPSGAVVWATRDGIACPSVTVVGAAAVSTGGITTDLAGNIYVTSAFSRASINIGGFALFNTDPTGNTRDVFVAKYSPAGAVVWATSFGGSKDDYSFGITVAAGGDIYLTGAFYSPLIAFGASVINDPYIRPIAYIARLSAAGTPLWAQAAGNHSGSFGFGIASDNSGNVYMTGGFLDSTITFGAVTVTRTYLATAPQLELYLVKYNTAGIVTWSKTIGSPTSGSPWYTSGVWGQGIALAPCGQIWVSGARHDDINIDGHILTNTFAVTDDPVFIAGYDFSGSVAGYSGLRSGSDDQVGLACDAAGNIFLTGDFLQNISIGPDFIAPGVVSSEYFYIGKYISSSVPPDTIHTHTDTSFCDTAGLVLSAPAGYAAYYWDNGATGSTRTITTSGVYKVYCLACGTSTLLDSFIVTVPATDTVHNRSEDRFCGNPTMTLNAPAGYISYIWDNGSTSTSRAITGPGIYRVFCSKCGVSTLLDSFVIRPQDTVYKTTASVLYCDSNVTLAAPAGYDNYYWNDGSSFPSLNVSVPGEYAAICVKCGLPVIHDSFTVSLVPRVQTSSYDTTICTGNIVSLNADEGDSLYQWSTGATSPTIDVDQEGVFWVQRYRSCKVNIDTFTVHVNYFRFDLPEPGPVCPGMPVRLAVTVPYNETIRFYRWTPTTQLIDSGITSPAFLSNTPGNYRYYLSLKNSFGCVANDSVTIQVVSPIDIAADPGDVVISYGTTVQLSAVVPGGTGAELLYLWSPADGSLSNRNISNPLATPSATTTYTVIAISPVGCRDTASETVTVIYKHSCLPDAFTPNGDGLNDVFRVCHLSGQKLIRFDIYNRWGELIYGNNYDILKGWDGTYKGVPQENGVYNYMIIIEDADGLPKMYKGDVTLIR